jgi:hypothetical protein
LFIAVGQAIFQNKLIPQMQALDPSLTSQEIVQAGATGLKLLVSPDLLPKVISAYANSLDHVFYISVAMACIGAVNACFVEFRSVKKKNPGVEGGAVVGA